MKVLRGAVEEAVRNLPEEVRNGVFELLEQRAGKHQVQACHVLVAFVHPRDAVVAPQDLLDLVAFRRVVQLDQVAQRLVHRKANCVVNLRHRWLLVVRGVRREPDETARAYGYPAAGRAHRSSLLLSPPCAA